MKTSARLPGGPGLVFRALVPAVLLWGLLVPPLSQGPSVPAPAVPSACEGAATPDAAHPAGDAAPPLERAQLFEQLGVRAWHEHGFRGRGVKVAVLDSGFWGYREHLGHALPAQVQTRSFRFDGNLEARDSQHGILCAEVVHALAPEAELLLANWEPEDPGQFLAAVRWARGEGARVLTCSVIMPTWSDYEGHGRAHEELTRLLGGDALCFASAGNTAQRHWGGTFHDGGDGFHEWRRTNGHGPTENAISPWGGERVSVELCCPPGAVYEVLVHDTTARRMVGRSLSSSGRMGSAVVGFQPEPGHAYSLRVRRVRRGSGPFHVVVLGGGLQYATSCGSIPFPGDGPEVVAVGAVGPDGRRLAYSSCGPKQAGTKPDLVACVPFPSSWRVRPFAGTSAAAPQAAALAALIWSGDASRDARQVRDTLCAAAGPVAPSALAWQTGHGRLRLPPPGGQSASLTP
jgi:hypothetical protein